MLRAVNEGYGYLIRIAPLQFGVAVHIDDGVGLAGLSTHGSHLGYRLVAQMTAVPGEYDGVGDIVQAEKRDQHRIAKRVSKVGRTRLGQQCTATVRRPGSFADLPLQDLPLAS